MGENNQFLKFVLAGGIAALANFLSRICFGYYMSYVSSIVAAYLVGMLTAYVICRLWVFVPRHNSLVQQISYFTLVNVFAVLQTLAVSLIFANYIFVGIADMTFRESASHFIGICVPIFSSYFGHKFITFR